MEGMAKCKICGRSFALMAEKHYIARDTAETGLATAFGKTQEVEYYDAFDCPHCGCQNIMQERKRTIMISINPEKLNNKEKEN